MRSALVRDASLGAAALALMSAADVELAVGQLSTADARVVLDAIAPATAEGDVAESATILLAAHRALGAPPPRGDEERWSLRLVAEALRNAPRRSSGAIAEVARAIARLAIVAGEHAARFAIVRRLLAEGNASGLRLVLDAADAERIAPLARVGRTLVETIVEQVVDTMTPRVVGERARTAEVDWMPFGAPLLLAPLAAALPLDEATRDWPSVGGEDEPAARCASASALVRLFAMATACGGERAARVLADPTTRWLAGVGSAVSVAQLRDWLAQIGVARAERLDVTVRDWRTNAAKLTNSHWSQTAADTNTPGAAERRSAERNWLELPTSLGVPRPLELAVAIIADGMLRDLAWRLPGFASASLPHLWKNFFAVEAHIVHEPQRLVAQLSRPPLAMVIAMTGLLHQSYRLPWCDGKQIALFMGDG